MCPLEHDRTSGYASRISRVGDAYPYPDAVSGDVHCAPTYSVRDVACMVILYGSECFFFGSGLLYYGCELHVNS